MRLLIICDAMSAGGTEILTANLANALKAKGIDIFLIVLPLPNNRDFSALKILDKSINYSIFTRKSIMDPTIFGSIRKKYQMYQPDVVLCQAMFSLYCFTIATFLLKKQKTFLVLHYAMDIKVKDKIFDWIYFIFIRFLNVEFIAIFKNQISLFAEKYCLKKDKFHLIFNGIDTRHFYPDRKKIKDDNFRILHVANMREEKDEKTLARSLVALNQLTNNWQAVLCGRDSGGIRESVVEILKAGHIEEKVRFIDYESDVRILLRYADVFVLSSISEALPVSVLEAMAMEVPCVLTNVGGCEDIVSDGEDGFLVQPKNATAIAHKLAILANDRAALQIMGMKARKKIVSLFGIEQMVNNYVKLFSGDNI